VWVSLDKGDDGPRSFWSTLGTALLPVTGPASGAVLRRVVADEGADAEDLPGRFAAGMRLAERPVLLVLDNLHEVNSPAVHEGLLRLIRRSPPTLSVLVITRRDPPWPLEHLRLAGLLTQIGTDELGFTADEAAALFARLRLELTAAQRQILLDRTEGWPAGLRLAAVQLQGRGDLDAAVAAFSGVSHSVAGYLVSEVLDEQPHELITFLRKISIVELVCADLADALTDRHDGTDPTVPDVLRLVDTGSDELRTAARASRDEYARRVDELVFTLDLLCTGSLAGVFDGPTTTPLDLDAPAVSVDISRVGAAGDTLVAAAMLCCWSYGFAMVDAGAVLADLGLARRRQYLAVMDELWRALRGASGLVEHADALTRLNRQKGMASIMITHSLADLDALPTEEDRAKARGFMERCAVVVLAGLPVKELRRVAEVTPLTEPEIGMVKGWAAPESWLSTRCTVSPWPRAPIRWCGA